MVATVGALRVNLGANTANFEAGMKRARREAATSATAIQRSLSGIKASFAGATAGLVGTATLVGLVSLTKRSLEYAASLGETAQQLGVTTEALQVFRFAGSQVGIKTEEMDTLLRKLSDSIAEAGQGSKAQAEAFNDLGINVKLANGELKDTDRVLREMADGFSKMRSEQDLVRVGTDLMGKSGAKAASLLAGGVKGIDEYTRSAHELNLVLSEEQIKNADRVADKIEELTQSFNVRIAGVVSNNSASILELANALATLAGQAAEALGAYLSFTRALGGGRQPGSSLAGTGIFSGTPIGLAAGIPAAINNFFRERRERATEVGIDLTSPIKPFVAPASAGGLNRIAGGGRTQGWWSFG